ncbi:MAG: hypothetical protein LUQ31_08905 [Methanoregula sp.]|nr:hypothetical protein [Methanoregula sp.]
MATMTLTRNIGLGFSVCVLVCPVFMIAAGKKDEIRPVFPALMVGAVVFLWLFLY